MQASASQILAAVLALSLIGASTAAAQEFTVDPTRQAAYKNYKFRVKWDGQYVPGIVEVSPLHQRTQVVDERSGADPSRATVSPGRTTFEPIVLVRGRTHDPTFEQWANRVYNAGAGPGREVSLRDYRKSVIIEVMNEAGQLVLAFQAYRCWPSEYMPIGELNALDSDTLVEKIVLQCEGFERDTAIAEPSPPSLNP